MAATVIVEAVPQPPSDSGYTYGQLTQKHPQYEGELWEKLDLLWEGGWAIKKNAEKFILQAPRENPEYYKWRCKSTSYVNFLARLVGFLTGSLFNETLTVGPATEQGKDAPKVPDEDFYAAFNKDADRCGTDFSQFIRAEGLAKALVFRRSLVQVDLPPARTLDDGSPPLTLDQEDKLGNRRAYLVPIELPDMFNWQVDRFGNFLWCVLHRVARDRSSPFADSSKYQHEFKVWRLAGPKAEFMVLRTEPVTNDNELTPESLLSVVQPWKATSFPRIPIRQLELPKALWAGNQAGPLCEEHFRRRSDLMGSLCRSLVEMPYVKLGPQLPAGHGGFPSDLATDQTRGDDVHGKLAEQGNLVLDAGDEIGYAGPTGVGHEIARAELKDCREEIFASVNAMALQLENSAAAVGRSGDSKAEDRSAMETLLTFMGDQTREFAQQVMRMVSEARAERVEWAASGLATFDNEDRGEVVAEAAQLETVTIKSPTWHKERQKLVALTTVPKASADTKKKIADEIEKNVSEEEILMDPFEKAKKMAEAQGKRDQENPPPGKGEPPAKGTKQSAGKA